MVVVFFTINMMVALLMANQGYDVYAVLTVLGGILFNVMGINRTLEAKAKKEASEREGVKS